MAHNNKEEISNRFENVQNLRHNVNTHFYGLMRVIMLEDTVRVLEDLRG